MSLPLDIKKVFVEQPEYVYQGRLAVSMARDIAGEYKQNTIAGILISPKGQPEISDSIDWENVQCEITIKVIKRIGVSVAKNLRVDQAMLHLANESNWKKRNSNVHLIKTI